MEYGNIKLSQICQMEINTLGHDCFIDNETFKSNKNEPEWANFKGKIKSEKNIDMENILLEEKRLEKIREDVIWLINDNPTLTELNKITNSFDSYDEKIKLFIQKFSPHKRINIKLEIWLKKFVECKNQVHNFKEKLFSELKENAYPELNARIEEIEKKSSTTDLKYCYQDDVDICTLNEILKPFHLFNNDSDYAYCEYLQTCNGIVSNKYAEDEWIDDFYKKLIKFLLKNKKIIVKDIFLKSKTYKKNLLTKKIFLKI